MAAKKKKMSEATKRMLRERREASKGYGKRPKKRGGKKTAKGLARSSSAMVPAVRSLTMVAPRGRTDQARLDALEHNQRVLQTGIALVAAEVVRHERALVGAGLLTARTSARKGGA